MIVPADIAVSAQTLPLVGRMGIAPAMTGLGGGLSVNGANLNKHQRFQLLLSPSLGPSPRGGGELAVVFAGL